MKIIKYQFLSCEINHGTEKNPEIEQVYLEKTIGWNEAAEEIAKREAHNGEYEIFDDGEPDPSSIPSQMDRVESQMAYLAMMTGYPEILEV